MVWFHSFLGFLRLMPWPPWAALRLLMTCPVPLKGLPVWPAVKSLCWRLLSFRSSTFSLKDFTAKLILLLLIVNSGNRGPFYYCWALLGGLAGGGPPAVVPPNVLAA